MKPLLIAIKGRLGSGKTTAADYLVETRGFVRVSFAGPLKEVAMKITPDGKIDKKRDRSLLQFLGTEYFRGIDPEYWVKKFIATAKEHLDRGVSVVTDDCRFENEKAAVKSLGGNIVFLLTPEEKIEQNLIKRDGIVNVGISGHASEADNDPADPLVDFMIVNDRGLNSFVQDVDYAIHFLREKQDVAQKSLQSGPPDR